MPIQNFFKNRPNLQCGNSNGFQESVTTFEYDHKTVFILLDSCMGLTKKRETHYCIEEYICRMPRRVVKIQLKNTGMSTTALTRQFCL